MRLHPPNVRLYTVHAFHTHHFEFLSTFHCETFFFNFFDDRQAFSYSFLCLWPITRITQKRKSAKIKCILSQQCLFVIEWTKWCFVLLYRFLHDTRTDHLSMSVNVSVNVSVSVCMAPHLFINVLRTANWHFTKQITKQRTTTWNWALYSITLYPSQ